jgi:uncharacterized protein DUF1592/uncharacterized protein DUF1588/uncharacterized protein DUF1587/uncharacterized protein DUF1595/uncharacterized protein DUF1585
VKRWLVLFALTASACNTQKTAATNGNTGSADGCVAGAAPLRRLTQTEYNNTVRDLLGDSSQPASSFPADSRNLGFDNNQQTLSVPPVLVTRYETAAEKLIADAWARDTAVSSAAWLRVCDPAAVGEAACAKQIVARFAKKAWRRAVDDSELTPLLALVDVAHAQGDSFDVGVQLALRAVLLSPNFVYRSEADTPANQPISDYALASRLSYFLWSSMPDDELFAKADAGTLHTPDVLQAEVRRMLADPKAQALVDSFGAQWLDTIDMPLISPDPKLFPQVTTSLKQAMHDETTLFFQEFLKGSQSALDMLDANFTFLNGELATFYGIAGVTGSTMQKVQLPAGVNRGGLLRQAGILALTSLMNRTSAVRRGKWVLSQLLCKSPPPPPPGIPAFPTTPPPGATQRQIMEQHSSNAACASCHKQMDPIGFSLENFDAVGSYRTQDNGAPIDATGTVNGQAIDGAGQLEQVIKADPALPACLVQTVYSYAVGRSVQSSDGPALSRITQQFVSGGSSLSELLYDVATSNAFTGHCAQ